MSEAREADTDNTVLTFQEPRVSVSRGEKPGLGVSDGSRVIHGGANGHQVTSDYHPSDPPPPDVISELTVTATPPPPPAWSDPPLAQPRHDLEVSGWPPEVRSGQTENRLDTDTESVRSSLSQSSAQSSVLVDMGKVTVNDALS